MKKVWKNKIIISAVMVLAFVVVLVVCCVLIRYANQPEQRIHAKDVEHITILNPDSLVAKRIEKSEDIEEVCDILNSIEILDSYPYEEMLYGGTYLRYVIKFTSGEEKNFEYCAGTSLLYNGEIYYMEDGRLELMWSSARYNFKKGTYDPFTKTVEF